MSDRQGSDRRRSAGRRDDDRAQSRVRDRFAALLGPSDAPAVPELEVAYLYRPAGAEVEHFGGDFLDFFWRPGLRQLSLVIGDVSGKGLEAASLAVIAKHVVRAVIANLRWPPPPGEAVMAAHNALLDTQLDPSSFITLEMGLYNAKDGNFTFASAGHAAPYVLRRGGSLERPLLLSIPAVGVSEEAELQPVPSESIQLAPGDGVLLCTDGLSEARNADGELYEDARLEQALGELGGLAAAELPQRLLADAEAFAGQPASDDVAMVFLRRRVYERA